MSNESDTNIKFDEENLGNFALSSLGQLVCRTKVYPAWSLAFQPKYSFTNDIYCDVMAYLTCYLQDPEEEWLGPLNLTILPKEMYLHTNTLNVFSQFCLKVHLNYQDWLAISQALSGMQSLNLCISCPNLLNYYSELMRST